MTPSIKNLNKNHVKKNFNCGKNLLDNYIKNQAGQDVKRDLSACFVAANPDNIVMGYYTLSSNAIDRNSLPQELIVKLPPSYTDLPTILLGRLAVDSQFKGKGLGQFLLIDALNRCVELAKQLGILAVVVDPIDQEAINFYTAYGFILLHGSGKMFITIKTIEDSLI